MAAADQSGPGPDLYQLLGVPRGASREEITLAVLAELAVRYLVRGRSW